MVILGFTVSGAVAMKYDPTEVIRYADSVVRHLATLPVKKNSMLRDGLSRGLSVFGDFTITFRDSEGDLVEDPGPTDSCVVVISAGDEDPEYYCVH